MGTEPRDHAGCILVAIDFSHHSEAALLWAARAAERFQAPLLALHVVHDPASAPGSYTIDGDDYARRMEERAVVMMREFVERVQRENPELARLQELETTLAVGLPPSRILEVAENRGATLIVMGSQGRTGLSHLLLGSKAERVAQLAPIPVTIVKAAPEAS